MEYFRRGFAVRVVCLKYDCHKLCHSFNPFDQNNVEIERAIPSFTNNSCYGYKTTINTRGTLV